MRQPDGRTPISEVGVNLSQQKRLPIGTVTVAFIDVVGSTAITAARGDEAGRAMVREAERIVKHLIDEHDGVEVKGLGDGWMAAFQSARRAVACACAIQTEIAKRNRQHPENQIMVRAGMHTGEVLEENDDLFGSTVNAAQRIESKATPGSVWISESVKAVMPRADYAIEDRGSHELKGFAEPWQLFEVIWDVESAILRASEPTPFVGRSDVRDELTQRLNNASGGNGSLVMLGGPPGVGKTRLTEELQRLAHQGDVMILRGHCYDGELNVPFSPLAEMIDQAARTAQPETFRATVGDAAPEIARIYPRLSLMFDDIPDGLQLPPEQERMHLFGQIRDFIARSAAAQPLLMIWEDLHWANESLLLLRYLAPLVATVPVLMVGTYRDTDVDSTDILVATLQAFSRERNVVTIAVQPMSQEDVHAMLRGRAGSDPPRHLVSQIFTQTEGIPFFVEEIFKHLTETGALFDESGEWILDTEVTEASLPKTISLAVEQRLGSVSEACRQALTCASILGRNFDYDVLAALEADNPDLVKAIEEGLESHLVEEVGRGRELRYRFTHELIRQTLVGKISGARLQLLHKEAAAALERFHQTSLPEHAKEIAMHLYDAGPTVDQAEVSKYLLLAGDRALEATAFEEARNLYSRSLELHDPMSAEYAAALIKRGRSLRSVGKPQEAIADWQQAMEVYGGLGDSAAIAVTAAELADLQMFQGMVMEALATAQNGLPHAAEGTLEHASLTAVLVTVMALTGTAERDPTLEQLRAAEAEAAQVAGPRDLGRVLRFSALCYLQFGEMVSGLDAAERSMELTRRANDIWETAESLQLVRIFSFHGADLETSAAYGAELGPLSERVGYGFAQFIASCYGGYQSFVTSGDPEQYRLDMDKTTELAEALQVAWIYMATYGKATADFIAGEWDAALAGYQAAEAGEIKGAHGGSAWGPWFRALAYAGHTEDALALLAKEEFESRPEQLETLGYRQALPSVVEGLAMMGEYKRAAKLYDALRRAMAAGFHLETCGKGTYETAAGIAAGAAGRWDEAAEHFERAIELADSLPHKFEQAEARRWLGTMLSRRQGADHAARSAELMADAAARYEALGSHRHRALID